MTFLLPHEIHLTCPANAVFCVIQEHKGINLKADNKYLMEKQNLYLHMILKLSKYASHYVSFYENVCFY